MEIEIFVSLYLHLTFVVKKKIRLCLLICFQTDSFEIKTLYLGNVTKIMIGHNESGRGCGWFCKQITVHAVNAPALDKRAEIIFDCNRLEHLQMWLKLHYKSII